MKVILKPAGILTVLVIIAGLAWVAVSDQAKSLFAPASPEATSGFVQAKRPGLGSQASAATVATSSKNPDNTGQKLRPAGQLNLSRVGKTDWVMYGVRPATSPANSAVRKSIAKPAIAPVEFAKENVVNSYGNDISAFQWSDGAGTNAVGDDVRTGIVASGIGSGFRVTVTPTMGKKQMLMVWVGGRGVRSKLQARMSDGSSLSRIGESYKELTGSDQQSFRSLYTIYFTATKPEQKLILSYLVAAEGKGSKVVPTGESNVSLQAIALD